MPTDNSIDYSSTAWDVTRLVLDEAGDVRKQECEQAIQRDTEVRLNLMEKVAGLLTDCAIANNGKYPECGLGFDTIFADGSAEGELQWKWLRTQVVTHCVNFDEARAFLRGVLWFLTGSSQICCTVDLQEAAFSIAHKSRHEFEDSRDARRLVDAVYKLARDKRIVVAAATPEQPVSEQPVSQEPEQAWEVTCMAPDLSGCTITPKLPKQLFNCTLEDSTTNPNEMHAHMEPIPTPEGNGPGSNEVLRQELGCNTTADSEQERRMTAAEALQDTTPPQSSPVPVAETGDAEHDDSHYEFGADGPVLVPNEEVAPAAAPEAAEPKPEAKVAPEQELKQDPAPAEKEPVKKPAVDLLHADPFSTATDVDYIALIPATVADLKDDQLSGFWIYYSPSRSKVVIRRMANTQGTAKRQWFKPGYVHLTAGEAKDFARIVTTDTGAVRRVKIQTIYYDAKEDATQMMTAILPRHDGACSLVINEEAVGKATK